MKTRTKDAAKWFIIIGLLLETAAIFGEVSGLYTLTPGQSQSILMMAALSLNMLAVAGILSNPPEIPHLPRKVDKDQKE